MVAASSGCERAKDLVHHMCLMQGGRDDVQLSVYENERGQSRGDAAICPHWWGQGADLITYISHNT